MMKQDFLGYRLMVGQRILIPSVLVRIQVAQPTKKPPLWRFFCGLRLPDENQRSASEDEFISERETPLGGREPERTMK